nr:DNA primase [Oscillospiraceae bacterium]
MSIYTQVKKAVSMKEAAERYGLSVTRHGMARCPFHEDHAPSLKLNEDYYYCFGCHATGDVIDFTSNLLQLCKYHAARQLAADFGIHVNDSEIEQKYTAVSEVPENPNLAVFRNNEILCVQGLTSYEWMLEEWKEELAPEVPGEFDPRYVHACQMLPVVKFLLDYLTVATFKERYALVESLMEDDTIPKLHKFAGKELGKKYGRIARRESEPERT